MTHQGKSMHHRGDAYETKSKRGGLTVTCPHCNQILSVSDELRDKKYLSCEICGKVFRNPHFATYGKGLTKWQYFAIAAGFILALALISVVMDKSKEEPIEEVQISEGLKKIIEDINIVKDEYIPKNGMKKAVVETGKRFSPLFEEYIGRPIGRQEILDSEPLATYLVTYIGPDLWRKMKLCRQSEEGIVKEVSLSGNGFRYYYDCYQDRPDGNYFAFNFDENAEYFNFELQYDGETYLFQTALE